MKNLIEIISDDIRKNWIIWVAWAYPEDCNFNVNLWNFYKKWDKLCTWLNQYYLVNNSISLVRASPSDCLVPSSSCVLYKHGEGPVTNSLVSVRELSFYVSNDGLPKVTLNITLQPSFAKWVKSSLIKESKMVFQTTISEKSF